MTRPHDPRPRGHLARRWVNVHGGFEADEDGLEPVLVLESLESHLLLGHREMARERLETFVEETGISPESLASPGSDIHTKLRKLSDQ